MDALRGPTCEIIYQQFKATTNAIVCGKGLAIYICPNEGICYSFSLEFCLAITDCSGQVTGNVLCHINC